MPVSRNRYTNQPVVTSYPVPSANTYTAGEDIGSNLVVRLSGSKVYKADCLCNPFTILGMSSTSALSGNQITVIQSGPCGGTSGLIVDATYFVGSDGVPTATKPEFGIVLPIGTAQDAATFNIKIGSPHMIYA